MTVEKVQQGAPGNGELHLTFTLNQYEYFTSIYVCSVYGDWLLALQH